MCAPSTRMFLYHAQLSLYLSSLVLLARQANIFCSRASFQVPRLPLCLLQGTALACLLSFRSWSPGNASFVLLKAAAMKPHPAA